MAITLLFPYIFITQTGQQISRTAQTVESLPISPDNRGDNLVLTNQVGVYGPGAYQWSNNRWQFVLSYAMICDELFGVSQAYVLIPNVGDNLLPVGDNGAAIVSVYKNGVLQPTTAYTKTSQGIVYNNHFTSMFDVYVVLQESPITPTMALTGGGISDAPVDGNAYVRKNAGWENIQNELIEGNFTGN